MKLSKVTNEPLVTAKEVMSYLRIKKTKLYQMIAIDCFPYYNFANSVDKKPVYRFSMTEIDAWKKQRSGFRN